MKAVSLHQLFYLLHRRKSGHTRPKCRVCHRNRYLKVGGHPGRVTTLFERLRLRISADAPRQNVSSFVSLSASHNEQSQGYALMLARPTSMPCDELNSLCIQSFFNKTAQPHAIAICEFVD